MKKKTGIRLIALAAVILGVVAGFLMKEILTQIYKLISESMASGLERTITLSPLLIAVGIAGFLLSRILLLTLCRMTPDGKIDELPSINFWTLLSLLMMDLVFFVEIFAYLDWYYTEGNYGGWLGLVWAITVFVPMILIPYFSKPKLPPAILMT